MNKKLSGLLPFSVISEKRPSDMTDIEQSRNVLQFTLFGVIGCFFLYLFAGISLLQGRSELGLYLLSFAVIGTVLTLYVRLTRHFLLASWLAAIMLMILSLYLVISGGAANTGPLWIYPVSAIILFIQGAHNGLKTLSVLLILVGVLFFIPLDFIAMPSQPLEALAGNRRGLDVRIGISIDEHQTGQILIHQPQGIIMILGLDAIGPKPGFPYCGPPEYPLEQFMGRVVKDLCPGTQDLQVCPSFKIEDAWRICGQHDIRIGQNP